MTTESNAAEKQPPPSPVEAIKFESRGLRGGIPEFLTGDQDHFDETGKQLLKFHGSYQQDDRDARKNRKEGSTGGKFYMFMVRARIPGGLLTANQYLAIDDLAEKYANKTVRLTSRQSIQFHGIIKDGLKPTIAGLNHCLLSTLSACGDVNRNVMACPAPIKNHKAHDQLQQDCMAIALHLAPKSTGYHEIWLDGKPFKNEQERAQADEEPIYGKVYLPRKFKTGLSLPQDNCIDIHSQDLGFLANVKDGEVRGYDVLVGGGMGKTHGRDNTFPQLSRSIFYVPREKVLAAAEAVVKLYRDHGNRSDRKRARIKYLVADWGVEKFREVLKEYLDFPLELPKDIKVTGYDSHLGWNPQGDGRFWYGISVENGRIKDEGDFRLRSALREIAISMGKSCRLTAMQDILICDLETSDRPKVEAILRAHGVKLPLELSLVQRYSLACPAIPTCGLAICESERALPGVVDELEVILKEMELEDSAFTIRMTGCPNGCVRPYQSDIGLVGRGADKYLLYLGGRLEGDRLNFPVRDLVGRADVAKTLRPVFKEFKDSGTKGESFGDFCNRIGVDRLKVLTSPVI